MQHYIAKSNVGSMCYCKPCRSLDLSVLVGILSGVDSDHGTGPRREGKCHLKVNIISNRKKVMLTKDVHLSLIWLITFCKLDNFFSTSQASNVFLACSILWGCN